MAAADPRIRFIRSPRNLGIAGAANLAGTLSEGEYVCFLDQDDTLSPYALESITQTVQDGPLDLIYSDEDYIDTEGRRIQPVFKPAFSPDLLRCCMYINHVRRSGAKNWIRRAGFGRVSTAARIMIWRFGLPKIRPSQWRISPGCCTTGDGTRIHGFQCGG